MENLLELNLAIKVTKQPKKDLRGFWDTPAPSGVVTHTSTTTTTTVNQPPVVSEVTVRKHDIAEFITKADFMTKAFNVDPSRTKNDGGDDRTAYCKSQKAV